MALRLRIVSDHAHRLGTQATKVFGVHGGTVGRATDNDWILPDPERYLSGKHLRLEFRAGTYFLIDTSSNGTFLNSSQSALGRSNEHQLQDGDYVRLGEYELLVSIDASNDFPPEEGAIVAYDGGPPSAAVRKSTANDIGSELDLSELLEPSGGVKPDAPRSNEGSRSFDAPRPKDAYGQSLPPGADETPWHMLTRPLKVDRTPAAAARLAEPLASPPSRKPNPFLDADLDSGLAAVCRGAGIDSQSIPPEARAAALRLAGQLLREVAVGLLDLAQSRGEFRNRFRISPPASELSSGSNFFSHGVDAAVTRLLSTTTTRGGSIDAIREGFQELKAQQTATVAAMRAAFEEFLTRFDPKELTERFERNAKRGVFGTQNKGRYWELYAELFAGMANRPANGFPHLFVEAFARAYEQQIMNLPPVKRIAFGTDLGTSSDQLKDD